MNRIAQTRTSRRIFGAGVAASALAAAFPAGIASAQALYAPTQAADLASHHLRSGGAAENVRRLHLRSDQTLSAAPRAALIT